VCVCVVTARSAECVSDAELMFVMATGAEMDPYYMPRLVEFITNLTRSLPVDSGQVRIGVMTYGLQPLIDISLGQFTSSADLIAALSNLTYHGTRYVHFIVSHPSLYLPPTHCSGSKIITVKESLFFIFTARHYAKRGICRRRVSVRLSVCLCVCLSHSGIVSERLNVGLRK